MIRSEVGTDVQIPGGGMCVILYFVLKYNISSLRSGLF